MIEVNKTMYIPLYGKALVSRKGVILSDKKAEEIWEKECFPIRGKAKSKYLAYYMAMRARVFDEWTKEKLSEHPDAAILHIGCGMDSRVLRVGTCAKAWYDVDFEDVISERKKYYSETGSYFMLAGDVRNIGWLSEIPKNRPAVVIMEGVSMYLTPDENKRLIRNLSEHFLSVHLLMDAYTVLSAKFTRFANPVKSVGVLKTYGIDDPKTLESQGVIFKKEHEMTPKAYISELSGMEKRVFEKLYAGSFSKKLYRMYEFESAEMI
ncbi:MAG: class I SAM-dependent methyltransferase [Clostridia bacterium]|nr:class I SAM-dependent methyltransferase [Clostridia bacterium]